MPRDEWLRAKQRADAKQRARVQRSAPKRMANRLTAEQIKARFNPYSPIGFGRYAREEIRNVPRDYLWWIVNTFTGKRNARTEALIDYLKEYLAM